MKGLGQLTGRPLTGLGGLLVVGSAGALYGGWSDTIQAAFRRMVGLPDADVSQPLLVVLLIVGLVMVLFDQIHLARKESKASKRLLAIRHTSLNPATVPHLRSSELPKEGGPWELEAVDCDLTRFLSGGSLHISGAVAQQQHVWTQVEAYLRGSKPPPLAYYGVAHVPLQILAGRQLAHNPPLLFELVQSDGTYRELKRGTGPNLGLRTQKTPSKMTPTSLVVRVAVSFPVGLDEVREIVPDPFDDVLVTVAKPARDIITYYAQAEAIAEHVCKAIDIGRQRIPGGTVHLFFAGPMSVGFSIGRRLSPSIHPEVIAYNYSMQTRPKYLWGLRVNSLLAPELLVEPVPVGAAAPPMRLTR